MQNHQILHTSTTRNFAVSRTIFRSLWPTLHISFQIKGKSCLGHILNTVLCMITKLVMVSLSNLFMSFIGKHPSLWIHNYPKMHVQSVLYPTLRSVQNETVDGRNMYLTGTLVFSHTHSHITTKYTMQSN